MTLDQSRRIPERLLPPLSRPAWDIEELLDMWPTRPAAEVLRGRMGRLRADALCLERYGRTFAQERVHRREQDAATKGKKRPTGAAPRRTYSYPGKGML